MKLSRIKRETNAFTLLELLLVIGIISILAALLLPVLDQGKKRSKRVWCENNLQQTGIGFHDFAHDHNGKLPMEVSMQEGGAMELIQGTDLIGGTFYSSYHQFQVLSNELATPHILICPADTRLPAKNFATLQNQNLSYFINARADFLNAGSILAGDRNIATNSFSEVTLLQLGNGSNLRWTRELHEFKGNILFADNHVEEWNNKKLTAAGNSSAGSDLYLPSVPPTNSTAQSTVSPGGFRPWQPPSGPPGGPPPGGSPAPAPPGQNSPATSVPSTAGNQGGTTRPPTPMPMPQSGPADAGKNPRPSSPAGNANNNGLVTSLGSGGERLEYTNSRGTVASNVPARLTPAPDNVEPEMSPVDQQIVKVLHGTVIWSYSLVLLLLLLYLAYKVWQMLRREKKPGRRNSPPPDAS